MLTRTIDRLTIDTLRQLATSTITCGSWGNENRRFFQESVDETSQIIGNKFEEINDPIQAVNCIVNSNGN